MDAFNIVMANYKAMEKQNSLYEKNKTSFSLRCTSRADLTLEERIFYQTGLALNETEKEKRKKKIKVKAAPEPEPLFPVAPDRLDYREWGYVTEVVDQGYMNLSILISS